MLWVWKAAAPSLFTIGPDIYVPYVSDIMKTYSRPDNPLLIPEVRKDAVTASYAFMHSCIFMRYAMRLLEWKICGQTSLRIFRQK